MQYEHDHNLSIFQNEATCVSAAIEPLDSFLGQMGDRSSKYFSFKYLGFYFHINWFSGKSTSRENI